MKYTWEKCVWNANPIVFRQGPLVKSITNSSGIYGIHHGNRSENNSNIETGVIKLTFLKYFLTRWHIFEWVNNCELRIPHSPRIHASWLLKDLPQGGWVTLYHLVYEHLIFTNCCQCILFCIGISHGQIYIIMALIYYAYTRVITMAQVAWRFSVVEGEVKLKSK